MSTSNVSMAYRVFEKIPLVNKGFYRTITNRSQLTSDFLIKKQGTGAGPFIDLPEFRKLNDSLLIKLPAFSSLYGNIDKISIMNTHMDSNLNNIMNREHCEKLSMEKLTTNEMPVNLIMSAPVPSSNIPILNFNDYKKGIIIPDIDNNLLCFAGDLSINKKTNEMTGFGILALNGYGPIEKLTLDEKESLQVLLGTVVAYESGITIGSVIIPSDSQFQVKIKRKFNTFLKSIKLDWILDNKLFFRNEKSLIKMQGPGTVYLQGRYSN
ncbi:hypothetical protein TPHA_0E01300 [Tetrapisispora phaffii CBS 4417]|uniref:Altered inheritance of mitochondria protein 24, mitochondrial n=1 Tax=Tetrapisispora phaffii (strain ATCC 24235 / CBS 4417 / NBRC 1672 / NRRL Y-8282 / UCD 70-5) TaxID=1071381 RepID=G8BTJ7_TETPH|nr:hypothetical protein TPHA_0E01300 [Tetrapisispora phaffii CBS 4417]CCE63225.1 hypothetical protein TPHA_0E01300 [Tetrapisispora phaffii CBS 4417]